MTGPDDDHQDTVENTAGQSSVNSVDGQTSTATGDVRADGAGETGLHPDTAVSRSRNSFLGDVWVNFRRWNLKAVRNPFVIVGSLIQPIIFFVLFTQVFGNVAETALGGGGPGVTYETYLAPAIAIQVSLAAAAGSGIGVVNDIENGMFEKTMVTPMNRSAVFLGKTAAEVLRIALQIVIILVLAVLLGASIATGLPGALAIIGVGIVFSLWFVALSNIIALVTEDQESTIIATNLLQFPLLFVSTAFLPLSALPGWIQTVATYNPITYGVDVARSIILGQDVMEVVDVTAFGGLWNAVVPGMAVLIALDIALCAIGVFVIARATSSNVR